MSQIKFSQKTIAGLPEALEALLLQINAQGSAGSSALTAAINAEIAARTAADTTISNLLDTVNGASTVEGSFRKAIADVIGSAPEALNTLKEIADYIAVNPSATVADAINAAIAAANTAVTDLTAAFEREKQTCNYMLEMATLMNDVKFTSTAPITGSTFTFTADAKITSQAHLNILNFGKTRIIDLLNGVGYDLDTTLDFVYSGDDTTSSVITFTASIPSYFASDIAAITSYGVELQYTRSLSPVALRAEFNS
jgi:hypothetical protein